MTEAETATVALERAVDVLEKNLLLLSGHRPQRQRLVPGQAHVHRIALTWCGPGNDAEICLQVLAQPSSDQPRTGWLPAEAQAVAEALDLKARGERCKARDADAAAWSRSRSPRYHLVLLDTGPSGDIALGSRCAALEAGFLDGGGWLRLYADGRFGEGTFTRVVDRVHSDVRQRFGPCGQQEGNPERNQGLC